MKDWRSQTHVQWECKDHMVIVPEYRRKVMYGKLRHQTGEIFRQLCRQKGVELVQGHAMAGAGFSLIRVDNWAVVVLS